MVNITRSVTALVAFTAVLVAATAVATAQTPLGRIEIGQAFPDETFPRLKDGRPASLSDYRGQRVLLLVFASW
jgi:hypothetical protein